MFTGLNDAKIVVLAVSGGPDSMALLHLASSWAVGRSRPTLSVATVDHGLRPEAAAEAAYVETVSSALGLAHATLLWTAPKPTTRIQERARNARYALLAEHARAVGAAHILTAHHADDQAETILMRLGRGTGLDGLGGMRRETALAPGIVLVRPLLDVQKSELLGVCRDAGRPYVEDPSNSDPAYARVRLRAQASAAASLGLNRHTLIRLSRRARRAEAALDAEARRLESRLVPTCRPAYWSAQLDRLQDAEPEILIRLLRRAITHVVGPRQVRLDRLERLTEHLVAALADRRPLRATLGGALIVVTPQAALTIEPEPPRWRGRLCRDGTEDIADMGGRTVTLNAN